MSKTTQITKKLTNYERAEKATAKYLEENAIITYTSEGFIAFTCAHCGKQYKSTENHNHLRMGRLIKCLDRHIESHGVSHLDYDGVIILNANFVYKHYPQESVKAREERKFANIYWDAHVMFLTNMPKEMRKLWQ